MNKRQAKDIGLGVLLLAVLFGIGMVANFIVEGRLQ